MFYEIQWLQILSKSSDMKSLIKSPTKKIFCVVFLYAKINFKKTGPKSHSQNKLPITE